MPSLLLTPSIPSTYNNKYAPKQPDESATDFEDEDDDDDDNMKIPIYSNKRKDMDFFEPILESRPRKLMTVNFPRNKNTSYHNNIIGGNSTSNKTRKLHEIITRKTHKSKCNIKKPNRLRKTRKITKLPKYIKKNVTKYRR
jgi:hypothetical protein